MGNCWSFQANPKYFPDAVLLAHNYYRAHHGAPPLVLDKELCKEASMEANLCAYHNKIVDTQIGKRRTQNTFKYENNANKKSLPSPFFAVTEWYTEIRKHFFNKLGREDGDSSEKDSKAFQRLAWAESRSLGVGFARAIKDDENKNLNSYLVCLYSPDLDEKNVSFNVYRPLDDLPARPLEPIPYSKSSSLSIKIKGIGTGYNWSTERIPETWAVYATNPWAQSGFEKWKQDQLKARSLLKGKKIIKKRHNKREYKTMDAENNSRSSSFNVSRFIKDYENRNGFVSYHI